MTGGVNQLCERCGSPLRPCRCVRDRGREVRGSTLRVRRELRARAFSERYPADNAGERYGPLFRAVRELPCWAAVVGYDGPGHERCGPGQQGGHTACHLGRLDRDGLIPGCGRLHDLIAGRGGRSQLKAFRAFLDARGLSIDRVGRDYVHQAGGEL